MYSLKDVEAAIRSCWAADTAYPDDTWTSENPARAHCVVTSLVVQHFFGGELEKLTTEYDGRPESHYRNILPDGRRVDFTITQYPPGQTMQISDVNLHGYPNVREKMLHEPDTKARYDLLLSRVERQLAETT